jgi:hypothetical protein
MTAKSFMRTALSSRMWCRIVRHKLTDVSEELTKTGAKYAARMRTWDAEVGSQRLTA